MYVSYTCISHLVTMTETKPRILIESSTVNKRLRCDWSTSVYCRTIARYLRVRSTPRIARSTGFTGSVRIPECWGYWNGDREDVSKYEKSIQLRRRTWIESCIRQTISWQADSDPRRKTSELTSSQILQFLSPNWIKERDDKENSKPTTYRVVSQSSPLNPTLFNIFMYILTEVTNPKVQNFFGFETIVLADDVQLRSNSRESLQISLNQSWKWTNNYDMT